MRLVLLVIPLIASLFGACSASATVIDQSLFSLRLLPGASQTQTVTVTNDDIFARAYRLVVQDFVATDETGTPRFIPETEPRLPTTLVNWISFDGEELELLAGESRQVSFTISVPSNALPGGYYGALLFASTAAVGESTLESRLGPLIVLAVGEETDGQVEITSFTAGHVFFSHLPVEFFVKAINHGTMPVAPIGQITITNAFGSARTVMDVNPSGGHVLGGQSRVFGAAWQEREVTSDTLELVKEIQNFAFGYYTAWLTFSDGSGETQTAQVSFWVIPWQLLLISLVIFIALVVSVRRAPKSLVVIFLAILSAAVIPRFAFASALTSVSDFMASQTVSTASNHEIAFTTPTGAAEGTTITITFAASFDTSTITEDDVDVEIAGTDRTTATSCAGSEQLSVALSADVLTITVCSGDGGTIASTSSIVVKIGANATDSGSGSNRIVNPASEGTYGLAIAGTFGDFGSIGQSIVSTSSGTLTAVVPSTSSGSGGGGGSSTSTTTTTETPETTETEETTETTDTTETTGEEEPAGETTEETSTGVEETPETTTSESAGTSAGTEETVGTGSSGSGVSESAPSSTQTTPSETTTGGVSEEEPVVESGSGVSEQEITYVVEDDKIILEEENDTVSVLPDRLLTIIVPDDALTKEVDTITVTIDGETYSLTTSESGGYETAVVTPDASGEYQVVVSVNYSDGSMQTISTMLDVQDLGYVYEQADEERVRVEGALVTLYESQYGEWIPVESVVTEANGTFGWYVIDGIYRVGAEKDGYQEALSDAFSVFANIAAVRLELEPLPESVAEILSSEERPTQKAIAIVASLIESADMYLDLLREQEEIQVVADVAAPVVVTLAVTSGVVLWNVFQLAPFLQYVLTSPLLLFGRRKRKAWGVVYHAGTKLPLDLAIVRLFKLPENTLVATRVTDKAGRYFFLAQPGTYRVLAAKSGFVFPSQLSAGLKEDGPFLDVYSGQEVLVNERDATIAANIPLDPTDRPQEGEFIRLHRLHLLRRLQGAFAVLGLLGAAFILVISPGVLTFVGLVIQLGLYGLFRRLARARKPKSWGVVYDEHTHRPLHNAIVRIFEPKYNKLLETAVTDATGRYSFLVGPNEYYVTYDRNAYQTVEVRPLDMRGQNEAKEVAVDVGMEKQQEV